MTTTDERFATTRWPRTAVALAVCAFLVALGAVVAPAARAMGPVHQHRPVGKVFVTNDAPHLTGLSLWDHSPDQDLTNPARLRWHVDHQGASAAVDTVASTTIRTVHSRGPPVAS